MVDISNLKRGDIIRHKGSGDSLVVTSVYGDRVTAVRTYDVTNPSEWILVWRQEADAQ